MAGVSMFGKQCWEESQSTGRLMQVEGAQTLKRQVLLSRTSGDGIVVEKQV